MIQRAEIRRSVLQGFTRGEFIIYQLDLFLHCTYTVHHLEATPPSSVPLWFCLWCTPHCGSLFVFAGDNIGWADLFGPTLQNASPVEKYFLNECCKCLYQCVCVKMIIYNLSCVYVHDLFIHFYHYTI